jgi:hypothetical protein
MNRHVIASAGVVLAVVLGGCGGGGTTSGADRAAGARSSTDAPVLRAGEKRTFPAGDLAARSTVACVSSGLRAEAQVPEAGGNTSTSGHAWTKDARATIRLDVLAAGAVTASCE